MDSGVFRVARGGSGAPPLAARAPEQGRWDQKGIELLNYSQFSYKQ